METNDHFDPQLFNTQQSLQIEGNQDDDDGSDFSLPTIRRRSAATPLGGSRKKTKLSIQEIAAKEVAASFVSLGESIKEAWLISQAPIKTHFDSCLEILNEMNNKGLIENKDYFRICEVLEQKEAYAAMFYSMSSNLRLEWLKDKELIEGAEINDDL